MRKQVLILEGADVNRRIAVVCSHAALIQLRLVTFTSKKGSKLIHSLARQDGMTCLHRAALGDFVAVAILLLAAGADPRIKDVVCARD